MAKKRIYLGGTLAAALALTASIDTTALSKDSIMSVQVNVDEGQALVLHTPDSDLNVQLQHRSHSSHSSHSSHRSHVSGG